MSGFMFPAYLCKIHPPAIILNTTNAWFVTSSKTLSGCPENVRLSAPLPIATETPDHTSSPQTLTAQSSCKQRKFSSHACQDRSGWGDNLGELSLAAGVVLRLGADLDVGGLVDDLLHGVLDELVEGI